jgi:transposase
MILPKRSLQIFIEKQSALMPSQPKASRDIKARIPALHYELGYNVKKICKLLDIKKSLAYWTLQLHLHYGVTVNPHAGRRGRHCNLTTTDHSFICALLDQQHTVYLDEIQEQLLSRCGVKVSIPTLHCLHFTHKDVSRKALKCNDRDRAIYMNWIADLITDLNQLMCGDEASKDERTANRHKGWSKRGVRCVQRK